MSEPTPNETVSTQNEPLELNEQTTEESQLQTLISTIEKLEQDVKEAKESAARANAESYNAQRRMEQETDKAKKFALQKFAKELLDVVDNLERAIANITDDAAKEGVELTHKSLLGVLEKNGVVAVGQVGDPFNPDIHEAVGIFPDAEKDVIGQVLQMIEKLILEQLDVIESRVGEYIYLVGDENVSSSQTEMNSVVANLLVENEYTISIAESLTGGKITSMLVEESGISNSLLEGIVCYSNESKILIFVNFSLCVIYFVKNNKKIKKN